MAGFTRAVVGRPDGTGVDWRADLRPLVLRAVTLRGADLRGADFVAIYPVSHKPFGAMHHATAVDMVVAPLASFTLEVDGQLVGSQETSPGRLDFRSVVKCVE
jgi:hypothetical protein